MADKGRRLADWPVQPFRDCSGQLERLHNLLNLSITGISIFTVMPNALEALLRYEEALGKFEEEGYRETADQKVARVKVQAELAQREVSEGFPLLYAQYTIAIWSTLEATIRLFVARWLQNSEGAFDVEDVQKLRVKIGEYARLEGEERFFYIVDKLEQELSAPQKSGVNRFESLLGPFGLSGPIPDGVRRDLFELNQVRNVLVHRSGIVDRKFTEACPNLQVKPGQLVAVDRHAAIRYTNAVQWYIGELIIRIAKAQGVDIRESTQRYIELSP
ncbi:MAG: hypothetical protein U0822_17210 [Anaerolineae bacterium]